MLVKRRLVISVWREVHQAINATFVNDPKLECHSHREPFSKVIPIGSNLSNNFLISFSPFQLDSSQEVKLHPSSVMFGFKPELVVFCHLMATQKSYIRDLSLVDPVI